MTELSDQIVNHLELIGYETEVELDKEDPSKFSVHASGSLRRNFSVIVSNRTTFFSSWYVPENKSFDYELVNKVNRKNMWVKTFVDEEGDFGFYMYLTGDYERRSFGQSVDRYLEVVRDSIEVLSP